MSDERTPAQSGEGQVALGRPRDWAVALAVVLVSWFVGDLLGAAVAVGALVAVRAGVPPRYLPMLGAVVTAAVPVAWIAVNLERWGEVSFDVVNASPVPSALALTAVILLLAGVALELTSDRHEPRTNKEDPDDRP